MWSVKCAVCSVQCEVKGGVRCGKCDMESVDCEVCSVRCAV